MKYIDADRLRAEIKFAKSVYDNPKRVVYGVADAYRQDGRAAMCDDILKKIDSLQQEQQEVDLEKEFNDFLEKENAYVNDDGVISYYNGDSFERTCDIYPIARQFYQLGLNARKKERK